MDARADVGQRRVLFIIDGLGPGGAERQMALLASHLPACWESLVVALEGGRYAEELRQAGIPLEICARRFALDVGPAWRLWGIVRRFRPHLIHSWGWMSACAAEAVCRLQRLPHVGGTIRRGTVSPRRRFATRVAARLGDRIIANSRAGLEAHGVPSSRGRVVYNGFDPTRLRAVPAARTSRDGPLLAVMAATVDDRKDFPSFLAAARLLNAAGERGAWRFEVLGDGPDLPSLRLAGADLVEAGVVRFVGRVPEVMAHYAEAGAGVMMSTHGEGFSNSVMEYMLCGLPVVCSEGGGSRELVRDGETGFLVPAGDAAALAERLRWLRAHPAEAAAMGEAGRALIHREHSVTRMVADMLAVYAEVLG